ncbi:hypothetical protein K2224_14455 [Streptomyces sp. BHT-5-2]|uniref:DUF6461 domain-containing protein n=1 Tax=unclassified Streptomyces TaxID=2593676 RepID=UPI001C8EE149|nr:DUF6461 domain-containing protein [Streptomyces sp. BHT-5-2]QZL04240.1 hypothetical protein K2224_14455 [Streptomyces sp. BHT-5-2]
MEAETDVHSLRWAAAWVCVTFTRGLSPEEVFTRYGAEPSRARLLDWDAASDLVSGDSDDGMVSLLRSGRIGEWAFCVEEEGGIGFGEASLAALSRGTETYSVATTEGIDVFQYWRDGECVEYFEPGMEHTRPVRTSTWWDRVEEKLAAHEGEGAGMAPVVALVLDHLGIALDDAALAGPWPSLTLAEEDAPSAPLGDTYMGEGPVPPGTVEIL